jgi:hypothetical protein
LGKLGAAHISYHMAYTTDGASGETKDIIGHVHVQG